MPLPTTQPTDWPDWGAVPTFTTQLDSLTVTVPTDDILLVETGYFSNAMFIFDGQGDGSSWNVLIQQLTGSPSEGFSVAYQQSVTHVFGTTVVIPMTIWTPWIRIRDEFASAYPHTVLMYTTLYTNQGFQTGYPGGLTVVGGQSSPAGGATASFFPNGCAPGLHCAQVTTNGTTWDLHLRNYLDYATTVDILLADETTAQPYNITWIAPPQPWELRYTNNDAGAHNVSVICNRLP